MPKKQKTLGEICRGAIAQAFNDRRPDEKTLAPRALFFFNKKLKEEADSLHSNIEAVLNSTKMGNSPVYKMELLLPCKGFNLEAAEGFQPILDFCKKEKISIQAKYTLLFSGITGIYKPGIGIERIRRHSIGFLVTIDPSRKFSGLEWEENKMLNDLPFKQHRPV